MNCDDIVITSFYDGYTDGVATGFENVFAVFNMFIIETDLCIDFRDTRCRGNSLIRSGNTSRTISELIIKVGQ
jgi:hypothetical protein